MSGFGSARWSRGQTTTEGNSRSRGYQRGGRRGGDGSGKKKYVKRSYKRLVADVSTFEKNKHLDPEVLMEKVVESCRKYQPGTPDFLVWLAALLNLNTCLNTHTEFKEWVQEQDIPSASTGQYKTEAMYTMHVTNTCDDDYFVAWALAEVEKCRAKVISVSDPANKASDALFDAKAEIRITRDGEIWFVKLTQLREKIADMVKKIDESDDEDFIKRTNWELKKLKEKLQKTSDSFTMDSLKQEVRDLNNAVRKLSRNRRSPECIEKIREQKKMQRIQKNVQNKLKPFEEKLRDANRAMGKSLELQHKFLGKLIGMHLSPHILDKFKMVFRMCLKDYPPLHYVVWKYKGHITTESMSETITWMYKNIPKLNPFARNKLGEDINDSAKAAVEANRLTDAQRVEFLELVVTCMPPSVAQSLCVSAGNKMGELGKRPEVIYKDDLKRMDQDEVERYNRKHEDYKQKVANMRHVFLQLALTLSFKGGVDTFAKIALASSKLSNSKVKQYDVPSIDSILNSFVIFFKQLKGIVKTASLAGGFEGFIAKRLVTSNFKPLEIMIQFLSKVIHFTIDKTLEEMTWKSPQTVAYGVLTGKAYQILRREFAAQPRARGMFGVALPTYGKMIVQTMDTLFETGNATMYSTALHIVAQFNGFPSNMKQVMRKGWKDGTIKGRMKFMFDDVGNMFGRTVDELLA